MVLFSFLVDTSLIPLLYTGRYAVPLTIVSVMLIGMLLGRMYGLLYGTIGGLLGDITAGTVGLTTFYYMAAGFIIGLILYSPGEALLPSRRNMRKRIIQRVIWFFVIYALGEIALFVYQYFYTATFHWIYLRNIAIRSLICTAAAMLLQPLYKAMLVGKKRRMRAKARNQEVKSY